MICVYVDIHIIEEVMNLRGSEDIGRVEGENKGKMK